MKKWLAIDAFRHLGAETKDSYAWSSQSPDGSITVDNAIAGCPNCHRRLHHADDREQYRTTVIAKIARLIDHPKRRVV